MQAAGWGLTAVLPHSADPAIVARLRWLWRRTKGAEIRALAERIEHALPERFDSRRALAISQEWYARRAELAWGRLRELHRSGWRVRIDVEGGGHLDRALEQGRGAVIWFMSFCDSFLLMRGLAQRGVPTSHLSSYTHGAPGKSWFGVAAVARVHRSAEDRYLSERVVLRDPRSPSYVRRLRELLAANHAVTIRGDGASGAPLRANCLGVECTYPGGAPSVAFQARSPLLTSYAERLGPAHYRVVVQEPVAAKGERRRDFVRHAVAEYARRLDEQLAEDSPSWEGWWWINRLVVRQ